MLVFNLSLNKLSFPIMLLFSCIFICKHSSKVELLSVSGSLNPFCYFFELGPKRRQPLCCRNQVTHTPKGLFQTPKCILIP